MEDEPDAAPGGAKPGQAVREAQGTSGIIGGVGDIDPYAVQSSKSLDYR